MPPEIELLGRSSCEDSAIVRSRLCALGIPFRDRDVDADRDAEACLRRLNHGRLATPLVVFGSSGSTVVEPTIEALDGLLEEAGWVLDRPRASQLRGVRFDRSVARHTLPRADGGSFALEGLLGRRQALVFVAHRATCLACWGYAKQLAAQGPRPGETDSVCLVVVEDGPTAASSWLRELPSGSIVACDQDGSWRREVAGAVGAGADPTMLLVLDRLGAPRAASFAGEAGGLIAPDEAVAWSGFVARECPTCGGEAAGPE